ncbi:hypothetical protein QVD17_37775 [Tagetes erecta]|uniref:PDZ domain-containing protein n=1 Tax=Tagetes erecta TaxID=13708 RepID=A0AAD8NKB6_TARER|nr:hypothetical protein QVD17_37775 [Tagetes erecta]
MATTPRHHCHDPLIQKRSRSRKLAGKRSETCNLTNLRRKTHPSMTSGAAGVSIQDVKRGVSVSFLKPTSLISKGNKGGGGVEIKARKAAGASKEIEVEVDKPFGLTLGPKPVAGGGFVITGVDGGGNAAKAGLKVGDQVIYTSSFFGDDI